MSLSLTTTFTTPISQQKLRLPHPNPARSISRRSKNISCNQNQVPNPENISLDRRNVLIGLGALYGASTPMLGDKALSTPISPPNLSKCHDAYDTALKQNVKCCKPVSVNPVPFKLPDPSEPMRVRQPAHKVDKEYLAKFEEAITKMRALPDDDPRNYFQQAQIHCAFCNDAYDEVDYPNLPLQIHGSWLFPTWHRYYIYFWERILGKLINDPTFAIPYWNWDAPDGMTMPSIYTNEKSVLYDQYRNTDHLTALLDYNYAYGDANPTDSQKPTVILNNLKYLSNDFLESKNTPKLFMGRVLTAGEPVVEDAGYLETLHNTIHQWCGPTTSPNWDMGNLHTAARDTIFFGHHGNVDRMWYTYQKERNFKVEFDTPDWLNASFVFPDENGQVVTCKVSDSLDISKFRYTYQPESQPYLNFKEYLKLTSATNSTASSTTTSSSTTTTPSTKTSTTTTTPSTTTASTTTTLTTVGAFGTTPRALTTTIRALVNRPNTSRTADEKQAASEVLVINNIDYDDQEHARFDVYIAKPTNGNQVSSDLGEKAGSYVKIPNSHAKKKVTNIRRLGITNLLTDIDADSSDTLVVSLVPRLGDVTIGGLTLELVQSS